MAKLRRAFEEAMVRIIRETAKPIMDSRLVHYNYLWPHEGIGGLTPAEKAGIRFAYKNWLDIVSG